MKIALAQINTCIADLEGNVDRCLAAIGRARQQRADLVVLPEMAVPGYPPRDILFDASFVAAVEEATDDLARRAAGGPPAVVGTVRRMESHPPLHPGLQNSAVLISAGTSRWVASKRLLPGYDVYFEPRWFLPGPASTPITIAGRKVGVMICEDMWDEGYPVHPGVELAAAGADLLVCISASPYRVGTYAHRLVHARRQGCPLVYLNLCGANDELIFDGGSFVMGANGELRAQLAVCEEEFRVVDLEETAPVRVDPDWPPREETLFKALVLGIRDFAQKNRLKRAFVGLSGGVDSSLVAVLAAEALGPDRVTGVAIPSRYTDPRSTQTARWLCRDLGIELHEIDLEQMHTVAENTLAELLDRDLVAENIQARLRAVILMSFVNRYQGMLLNTSNKTELSLGYATLYGDMAGALCPIADLTKLAVYSLAKWVQRTRGVIPPFALERAPTAELRPGQTDPFDYPEVAPELEKLVQAHLSNPALRRSEHKRWQMGVILKVSEKSFGTGRMIPITRR